MVAARTVLYSSFAHRVPAGIPACRPSLPPVLDQALADFGLMPAFRSCSVQRQRDYIYLVASSTSEDMARDRVADVLDELATGSAAYSHLREW